MLIRILLQRQAQTFGNHLKRSQIWLNPVRDRKSFPVLQILAWNYGIESRDDVFLRYHYQNPVDTNEDIGSVLGELQ